MAEPGSRRSLGRCKAAAPHPIPPSSLITPWLQNPRPTHAAFPPRAACSSPTNHLRRSCGRPTPWEELLGAVPGTAGQRPPYRPGESQKPARLRAHHRLGRFTRPAVRVERTLLPLWSQQGQSLALHRSP